MDITKDEILSFLTNVLSPGQGEKSVADKLQIYIGLSEPWFYTLICDKSIADTLEDDLLTLAKRIIVLDAFYTAVPALDLVLTPNGFGIVSNQNLAPASKERVENLRVSLLVQRDIAIDNLWRELKNIEAFSTSHVGMWLKGTLFQDLSLSILLGEDHMSFQKLYKMHMKLIDIETFIAKSYISVDIWVSLKNKLFSSTLSSDETQLCSLIKANIIKFFADDDGKECFGECVDFIRKSTELYDVWKDTSTAELYEDYSFENDKNSGGVWL